jgi:actin-related protein
MPFCRYSFEQDVPVNLEGQEAMLDWAMDRLGLTEGVPHPLLLTEAALSPTLSRTQLAQLVFEAYGVPALSYVAAAPAAFFHHHQQAQLLKELHKQQQEQLQQEHATGSAAGAAANGGLSSWDGQFEGLDGHQLVLPRFCSSSSGLVICSGHSHTYVVPIYKVGPAEQQQYQAMMPRSRSSSLS